LFKKSFLKTMNKKIVFPGSKKKLFAKKLIALKKESG
jgi:hypothetical protein